MSDQHDILTQADLASYDAEPGTQLTHVGACIRAIASIGGDPATVGELVAAYKDAASALRYINIAHGALYGVGWERLAATSRAVLAKLPKENSND